MREIPLSRGLVAIVDDEDYAELSRHKWCASNNGYAVRNSPRDKGKQRTIHMHREILNPQEGMHTDHIDGNRLNNQRSNLRVVTAAQNLINKHKFKPSASKYKGVRKNESAKKKKWYASITVNGRFVNLGTFATEEDAARSYNDAAVKYHGEFATLNDINQ